MCACKASKFSQRSFTTYSLNTFAERVRLYALLPFSLRVAVRALANAASNFAPVPSLILMLTYITNGFVGSLRLAFTSFSIGFCLSWAGAGDTNSKARTKSDVVRISEFMDTPWQCDQWTDGRHYRQPGLGGGATRQ